MIIDYGPPSLIGLSIPDTIDVSRGDVTKTFAFQVRADGAEFSYARIIFNNPIPYPANMPGKTSSLYTYGDSSDDGDDWHEIDYTFLHFMQPGENSIYQIEVVDENGNRNTYSQRDLEAAGFKTSFTVVGAQPDDIAPVLTSLVLPETVDVSKGAVSVTASIGTRDFGSGVVNVTAYFGQSIQTADGKGGSLSYDFLSRPTSDPVVQAQTTISRYAKSGKYDLGGVYIQDKAGNTTNYTLEQLRALGVSTSITVTGGVADTVKPVLKSIELPKVVDLSKGDVPVTFAATAIDRESGIDTVIVRFNTDPDNPTDGERFSIFIRDQDQSFVNGRSWTKSVFDQDRERGSYKVVSIEVKDKSGNVTIYGLDDVRKLGFDKTLTVTGVLRIDGSAENDKIWGSAYEDRIDGKAGADTMGGFTGNDTYIVDSSGDQVFEARGNGTDRVVTSVSYALAERQEVEIVELVGAVGKGKFNLTGNEFGQTLRGDASANVLNGKGGADVMSGRGGDDVYVVDDRGDRAYEIAGQGKDTVVTTVSYALLAGQEVETLVFGQSVGRKSLDLTGNAFAQSLTGSAGANRLDGGLGNDTLKGGAGPDSFVFSTKLGAGNVDHIVDFASEDTIRLSKSVFTALSTGQLTEKAFKVVGKGKVDADDRILYKQATGELFYDADGSGKAAAVKFAVLDNHAALTHADILVV